MWMDEIYECTAKKTYGEVERLAADREMWRKAIRTDGTKEKRRNDCMCEYNLKKH